MRDTLIKARGNKTQMNVSAEIGISQKYLSKLELGQRTPSMKIAIRISSYYKISMEKLFPDIYGNVKCDCVESLNINQTAREQSKQMSIFDLDVENLKSDKSSIIEKR